MSDLNIYAIEAEYLALAKAITDNGGEITEEQEQALLINRENLEVKSAKYAYVTKKLDGEVSLIDSEIERLTALKNARVKTSEKLKDKIKQAMLLFGIEKIESQTLTLSFRPSKSVEIIDASLIPKKFLQKKVTYQPDKKEIKNVLDAGGKVKGAKLNENKNLQIK